MNVNCHEDIFYNASYYNYDGNASYYQACITIKRLASFPPMQL